MQETLSDCYVRPASSGDDLAPLLLGRGQHCQTSDSAEPRQHVLVLGHRLAHQGLQVVLSRDRGQVEVLHQTTLPHFRLARHRSRYTPTLTRLKIGRDFEDF